MTESLEKLRQKYGTSGACGPGEEGEPDRRAAGSPVKGWRSVPEIGALREYLDAHPELGARVGLVGESGLSMRFTASVDNRDGGKLIQAAFEAAALLLDAKPEILRLVSTGEIRMRRFE
ncbi:hypothetical protein [uncultured Desulfosarcina sp.]|uniref:hypothetical protein n=1 Tax=uncultured Desulfosarcina sp. TaxID=218289 RepID=UPI0029C93C44|nr:hypothetical protein [uncultured Desulfosarcina sp.]